MALAYTTAFAENVDVATNTPLEAPT